MGFKAKMKILVDLRVLNSSRGVSRYARNIFDNLLRIDKENEYLAILPSGFPEEKFLKSLEKVYLPSQSTFRDHFEFERMIKKYNPDLVFHPDNREFLKMSVPSVVTIHDLTPYKFPQYVFSSSPFLNLRQRLYYFLQKKAIQKNTEKIITVSENTRKDVISIFNFDSKKVIAIHEGIEETFRPIKDGKVITAAKNKYKIEGDYIFYIGGFGKHKNVSTLIKAFSAISNDYKSLKLVLGGKTSADDTSGQNAYSELVKLIENLKLQDKVVFAGFIDDVDLSVIYSGATMFIYPSLYEGFGFPPLEAMACGCPVISSNAGSLLEVVADGGVLFEPFDVDGLTQNILKLLQSNKERRILSKKGLAQATKFNWEDTARKTLYEINQFS